jgi:hypothetical protein
MTEEEMVGPDEAERLPEPIQENPGLERRQINLVFQAIAHLTTSMIQLHARLDCLEQTMIRTQDRLQAFDFRFQKRILGISNAETKTA